MTTAGEWNHFFRHEYARLTARLTQLLGTARLEEAEDIVQDVLVKAFEVWKIKGMPENPGAWLHTAARNRAIDVLRHAKSFQQLSTDALADRAVKEEKEEDADDQQLRMMFVCCHPSLPEESQMAMMLKTLSGFSVKEIARAFIAEEEAIAKRLYRAKEQFRKEPVSFELPAAEELAARLSIILKTIYLIYHEGYHATHHESVIRENLIEESLRLLSLVLEHPSGRQPISMALMALLCFHTARIPGRLNHDAQLLTLPEQDRSRWNQELIQLGNQFMSQASKGEEISRYHLEAAIAYEHCAAPRYADTQWKRILTYYDLLLSIEVDPIVQLNRMVAVAEVNGTQRALAEMQTLSHPKLTEYYLYYAVKAELYARLGNTVAAKDHWMAAQLRTSSPQEQELIARKIRELDTLRQS